MDRQSACGFAEDWIAGWNTRDLDRVLAHYTKDFEFSSPLIVQITGEPSGTLQGKAAVQAYWEKCLELLPDLHLELIDVLVGVAVVTLYYRGTHGMAAETLHFDATGKVCRATACYA